MNHYPTTERFVKKDGLYIYTFKGKNKLKQQIEMTLCLLFLNEQEVLEYTVEYIMPINQYQIKELFNKLKDRVNLEDDEEVRIGTYTKSRNQIKMQFSGNYYEGALTDKGAIFNLDAEYYDYDQGRDTNERLLSNAVFNFLKA